MTTPNHEWEQRNMTPEEMTQLDEFVRSELATGDTFVRSSEVAGLIGRCVEVGNDDDGQPRLIIHTSREQLLRFGRNLVYAEVSVTLRSPTTESRRRNPENL